MQTDRTSISAKVIADSVHEGSRLTTIEATYPRILLAEFNTHRDFSRNSASSRAMPVRKKLADIILKPFTPSAFGKNKPGMQAAESVSDQDLEAAKNDWLIGRDVAVIQAFHLTGGRKQIMLDAKDDPQAHEVCDHVEALMCEYPDVTSRMKPLSFGIHKQHANRVLEPYSYHTVLVSSTHWRNFYALRASEDAQPEIDELAIAMIKVHKASVPRKLAVGEWHLPFITSEDIEQLNGDWEALARVSCARSARISSLTHDGIRAIEEDLKMARRLQEPGHLSPFEHAARVRDLRDTHEGMFYANRNNFAYPWVQYRKMLPGEHDFSNLITREKLLVGCGGDEELVDFIYSLPA